MKITFTVGATYTKYHIAEAEAKEILALSNVIHAVCQARPYGYQYMPKYKSHMWDGYVSLCKGNSFPTGLMGVVTRALPLGLQVATNDNLHYPVYDGSVLHSSMFSGIELRPYQLDAASVLLHAKRGIAKMATNSGKTEVIAAMCKALQCDVMVLTTKVDLLYQTSERLHLRLGEVIGIIGDGHNSKQRVTVGMIQTLSKQQHLPDMDCVIYDEVHHLPSKTSQQVMLGIPALIRFGLSGTPLRHDDLNDLQLMAATGDVLVEVTNEELIKSGISAEPIISMVTVDDVGYYDYDMDYTDAIDKCIVNNPDRNDMIIKQATEASGVVLILVERLEHGKLLQKQLPESVFLNGGFAGDVRAEHLQSMRDGLLKIVIATPIFDEGVDVPAINTLILAGGGVSPIRLLQRLGRGMRRKAGDNNVLHVVDFVDATNKYLIQHSKLRAETYESEGFRVQLINPPTQGSIQ